jgi:hypothetical protein
MLMRLVPAKTLIWISTLPILGAVCVLAIVHVWRSERAESRAVSAEVELAACRDKVESQTAINDRLLRCSSGYWALQAEMATFLRLASYEKDDQ